MTTFATPPILTVPGATPELNARLRDGLARVDALLHEVIDHDDAFIVNASGHLLAAGGKRFRPLLTLLAAELSDGISDDVIRAAAGVELTHLASLYHDDVMDEADVRRGVSSVNAAYDNSTAILVGDLLFGKASELIADLGAEAVKIQAKAFVRLCTGQIRDDRPCPPDTDPVDYYLRVLADKTGVLIATAGRYGVMFSGADDLIDIASAADDTGKTPGTDLREGVDTLAVLHAKESTDPADARLQELLSRDLSTDDAGVAEALDLLRAHPALRQAQEEAFDVARAAQDLLAPLPDTPAKTALQALAISAVTRVG